MTSVKDAARREIVTLAGLGTPERPHPPQTAHIEEQVPRRLVIGAAARQQEPH
jgi:hypothetical protein